MRKHLIRRAVLAAAAVVLLSSLVYLSSSRSTYASTPPVRLAVLFTSDVLGNIDPCK